MVFSTNQSDLFVVSKSAGIVIRLFPKKSWVQLSTSHIAVFRLLGVCHDFLYGELYITQDKGLYKYVTIRRQVAQSDPGSTGPGFETNSWHLVVG